MCCASTAPLGCRNHPPFANAFTRARTHIPPQVSRVMWNAVQGCQYDIICGVPYTALPIATGMSLGFGEAMVMRRKVRTGRGRGEAGLGVRETWVRGFVAEEHGG